MIEKPEQGNLATMLLNELRNASSDLLYMERHINTGSPSGFTEKYTTSSRTRPKGDGINFHLCAIEVPESVVIKDFGEEPALFNQWQMLVHPDMISDELFSICRNIVHDAVLVAPTSSARTVMMLDREGWFIKLCYKGLIGRIERQLAISHAVSAIEVNHAICTAMKANTLPKRFGILREVFSRVLMLPHNSSFYEWGIVLRESVPHGLESNAKFLIPAFSLFSPDDKNPEDPTILTQLINNQNKCAEDFLFKKIICPVYDAYFALLLSCGLQLEAHAQNILFALDDQMEILGVVARDAESIDKDFSLINDLGLNNPFSDIEYKRLLRTDYNYHIMHSFMFDFKLGEYLIKPLIQHAASEFQIDERRLEERIREFNRRYIERLPKDFFPKNWYAYKNIVHDKTSRKRPYIATPSPRYR